MRKILLILAAFFVLATSPAMAIYRTDGEQPAPKDGDMTLMSTTSEADPTETTTTMTTDRMEAKNAMKSAIASEREAFKEKIKGIKDAKKAKIVENLDTRIGEMNKKKTTMMSERLERLTMVLSKISSRAASLKIAGTNTASIAEATQAIENAKTAVAEQAAKDYVLDVTTETALKTNAQALIKEFITDIKAVHEKVVLAQKAVAKVYKSAIPTPTEVAAQ